MYEEYENKFQRQQGQTWCPRCGCFTYQENWTGAQGCWSCNPDGWPGRYEVDPILWTV